MYFNIKKIVLFILLVIFINGCVGVKYRSKKTWNVPQKPKVLPVNFEELNDGLYIDFNSSSNLIYNINEMDAYIEKLEFLLKEMKKYYGDK